MRFLFIWMIGFGFISLVDAEENNLMTPRKKGRFTWRRLALVMAAAMIALYLLLLIPEGDYQIPLNADQRPFVWDRDQLWASLEKLYQEARATGCDSLAPAINSEIAEFDRLLKTIDNDSLLLPTSRRFGYS